MAGNTGGPWGGGSGGGSNGSGNNDGDRDTDRGGLGGRRPQQGQTPDIDQIVRKGQEQLRVLMGGRGGNGNGRGPASGPQGPSGPLVTRSTVLLGALAAVGLWAFASFYTVRPEQQSVELFLGEYSSTGGPGLNFAPWPFVTAEVVETTRERTESIGATSNARDTSGLMLTTDANIVDISFQVVWNINDPAKYLFNLADPEATIRAVSESAMREIVAASRLAPILNLERGLIADRALTLIQQQLDQFDAGINILRVNLDKADPPFEVIESFRDVQAAEQERDRLEREADAYANREMANARGVAAATLEAAEGYRAQVVNQAQGEASRFLAVLEEYKQAPEVTRRRLYIETMERVLGEVDKVILDDAVTGAQGVLPFLPLGGAAGKAGN